MTIPLQRTKLFAPAARIRLVERSRLMDQLDILLLPGYKSALISAPPGSGKTTLVNQWLAEHSDLLVGWVSLDERDNQPVLFFRYLVEAIRMVHPNVGNESLALLQLPGINLREVITLITNELVESQPFVLVLDDLHTVSNPIVLAALDYMIEAQPSQMRIILLTRQDPNLQLALRRARGQLVELRQHNLRFNMQEAVDFLNQCMALQLTVDQVQLLEDHTEGWIAGLQMAALSLQHSVDVDRFIREFSGSNRFILDYLMDEVFANQPEGIQNFLLETSVLDLLSAELCAIVTGRLVPDSQDFLDQLASANLFVFTLDEKRQWYRYHHLLKDLLLAKLKAERNAQCAFLYRRASDWHEENGDLHQAVEYAFKAEDLSHVADLIEHHNLDRWQFADLEFMAYANRLPEQIILTRPTLCLHTAWVYVVKGQGDRIPPLLDAAEQRLSTIDRKPQPDDPINIAFAKILRAYLADFENQPVPLDNSLREAYLTIPEEYTGMRNSVAVVLGTIHYHEGDFDNALLYYQDALDRDVLTSGTNAVPISTQRMVWVFQKQGRLRQAFSLVIANEEYIRQRGSRRFFIGGVLNLMKAEILLEWNQLDESQIQLQEGLRLLEDWPVPQVRSLGFVLLSRLLTAKNDLSGAHTALAHAEEMLQHIRLQPESINFLERAQVNLWKAESNRLALETFAREHHYRAALDLLPRFEAGQIELCRAWLALGFNQEAAALLDRLSASSAERSGSRILILALLAAARHHQPALSEAALDEALRIGEPESYVRSFVEVGDPLHQTIRSWLDHHQGPEDASLRDYATRILQAIEKPAAVAARIAVPDLPEPLSQREQQVLQLVAEGLTNQQIAARLVISIRTVKKHVENIHGKLGVQNRTQAVARGRAIGLLDP